MKILPYLGAATGFCALAVLWSWPLPGVFFTHFVGASRISSDFSVYAWNLWYFSYALTEGLNPLWTDHLYWPYGGNLILHHYSLFHDMLAYFLQPRLGLPGTYNLLVLLGLAVGAFGAFLLARDWGASWGPAFVAGAAFGFAPATTNTLIQGTSLDNLGLYGLPYFVWFLMRADRDGRLRDAFLAALALTWVWTYNYYFFLFSVTLIPVLYAALRRPLSLEATRRAASPAMKVARRFLETGLVLAFAAVLRALAQGQVEWHGDGSFGRLLAYVAPYLVFWGLLAARLGLGWMVRVRFNAEAYRPKALAPYLGIFGLWVAINFPMILAVLYFMATGDYGTTPRPWRGGGMPFDPLSLLINEPYHPLWGGAIRALGPYGISLGLGQAVSLGLLPLAAAAWLWKQRPKDPWVLAWMAGAVWTAVLTMGPWLKLAGVHTYLPLPFYFLHLLPVFNNLQHGYNCVKLTNLFLALILAAALTEIRRRLPARRAAWVPAAALLAVAFEFAHSGLPAESFEAPPLLGRIGNLPRGAMLPLPVGAVFNGLSATGAIGRSTLMAHHQAAFRQPIVGGTLWRVSRRVYERMLADPFLQDLIAAQNGGAPSARLRDRASVSRYLRENRLTYVLIDISDTPAALQAAVGNRWPLKLIDQDERRRLYRVL